MAARLPTPPDRILIARLSAVGDTVLTLPVASALRRAFPDAHIAWVVERKASPVVVGHFALDDVLVLERGWFTRPRRSLEARSLLRRGRFDVAIDCQGLTKSALACRASGARRRIGMGGVHGRELSPLLNNEIVSASRPHVVDRSLELLKALDIREPEVEWGVPIDGAARRRAEAWTGELGLDTGYTVVNPFATWASKRWEMDRFAAVIRTLHRRHHLPTLVIWGTPRERERATQVVAAAGDAATLAPPTTLLELAAVLERARLFLSADGGPLHLAVAVGTPTIGLYGPTRLEDCGPYGKPHVGIQVEHQGGTHRKRRRGANTAMRRITVEMVCAAADTLLGP